MFYLFAKKPVGCQTSVIPGVMPTGLRPKFFFEVKSECEGEGLRVSQFIFGHPALLRVRLWLGKKRNYRMLKQVRKFKDHL